MTAPDSSYYISALDRAAIAQLTRVVSSRESSVEELLYDVIRHKRFASDVGKSYDATAVVDTYLRCEWG